jgi:hypothetical protein
VPEILTQFPQLQGAGMAVNTLAAVSAAQGAQQHEADIKTTVRRN